jgi:serine/tyrosine/threonine adenylyltransferase
MSSNGTTAHPSRQGVSLSDLPKSHTFTTHLPADPLIPSPELSKTAPPQKLRISRPVNNALFTWVAPETNGNPQLLATSWKAVADLGLDPAEVETKDFLNLVSGNKIYEEHYPWGISSFGGY